MRIIQVKTPGGAENLYFEEVADLEPRPEELLVKVHATALNRADILQRKGHYPPPEGASPVLGLEIAGEVVKTGSETAPFQAGDRVFGLIPGGGYAEYAIIHQNMANRIPETLNYFQAAAIPEVFLTAYQAIVWLGELKNEKAILIHAGASGVGTAAIQIAKIVGSKILVTASPEKHDICLKLGADHTINYKKGSFSSAVMDCTNGKGVDLVIDFIGKPYFEENMKVVKTDGIMVFLAAMGGAKISEFDLGILLRKRLHLKGSTLRSRSPEYQVKLNKEFFDFAMPHFSSGRLKAVVDKVYDWRDVQEAHEYMESNKNTGKIVLAINNHINT